ncbi:MAG TPA: aspartate kinase [Candidatus Marinimicrobia bacterium]|nr:aspartate kinase [Candidatus Neomarinimicrobiota bacterium]HQE94659.1 aspartate kinase [Candidatus Neomarinimicrobiota bacterium]HQH55967.1 aspartate kinase [Candidatus Neomarinimicrobiota bacterium]HQK12043.1 aspartate kinase [Candidatus Neomarinimicrobiota bacterium]
MKTVVMKFGGSSVADTTRLRQVAEIVVRRQQADNRVVVVVSAMGKTTDALIAQAREVSANPQQRELDMLVTAGERISMALLSMAIQELGGDAISFTGSQSGIITEPTHQGARILEVRPFRLIEALEKGYIVIVAGYQGVSTTKEITTLGRGGSDTTAVALAAALGADSCEIYSDVDGVYTGDPHICPQAQLLREIPYEVMQTMALAGAKVLNADAVEFAKKAGITILARKTGDSSGRETKVHNTAMGSGATAIVLAEKVSRINGNGNLPDLLMEINKAGGRVMALYQRATFDLLVDRTGIPGGDAGRVAQLAKAAGFSANEVAVVTVVGSGLGARPSLFEKVEVTLSEIDIPILAVFANDLALSIVIEPTYATGAVRALHQALIVGK